MNSDSRTMFSTTQHQGQPDETRHFPQKPYVRIVVNEAQWPLLLEAIKDKEFLLREELRDAKVRRPTAVRSLRAQIKALGMTRVLLIINLRERGWLE